MKCPLEVGNEGLKEEEKEEVDGEEEAEEKPNLLEYLAKMPDGPTVYNLDGYGIVGLDNINFKDDTTEISLWDNKITDPYTVTEVRSKTLHLIKIGHTN